MRQWRWRRGRRGPRRGSAQCLLLNKAGSRSGKEPGAPSSCCSLSGPESPPSPPAMAARRRRRRCLSPAGRFLFSPAAEAYYSSDPEAAGGEGGLVLGPGGSRTPEEEEVEEVEEEGLGRKGGGGKKKSRASLLLAASRRRPPLSSHSNNKASRPSSPPRQRRLSSAWQQQHQQQPHLAGEGSTTSCTTLYGGDFLQAQHHHHHHHQAPPIGRSGTRLEELLRDREEEPCWATPVAYPAATDTSKAPSLCPSSFSFSQLDRAKMAAPEEMKARKRKEQLVSSSRKEWQALCESSPSLADLMHSLRQYEEAEDAPYVGPDSKAHQHHHHHLHPKPRKRDPGAALQDLELLPERDKKIAALMLARHHEEEDMKDRQLEVSEAWEKMRQKEKKAKARMEKERQYRLADSLDQWQRDRDRRKSRLKLEEQQLVASRERDMMLRDKKWRKLAKEQEFRRREKSENARLQAEYRKRCQEKQLWEKRLNERSAQEHNSYAYKEKMLQALEKRLMKEMERKKRKTDMNEYRKARHIQAKEQVDDRMKADELYKRLCIEQKLQRSQEILEQLLEERNRELKEKTFKEEEQGMIAKARAKETEEEKRRRKEMLLQIAEMKIQQAREIMSKNIEDRAQRMKEINCMKERNHHCRKQKLDYDEKCNLRELQEALRRKDQKSNQILRQKDAAIEESRRLAKASYDLREKVRDLINHNSFDQMALDAHRNASLLRGL